MLLRMKQPRLANRQSGFFVFTSASRDVSAAAEAEAEAAVGVAEEAGAEPSAFHRGGVLRAAADGLAAQPAPFRRVRLQRGVR